MKWSYKKEALCLFLKGNDNMRLEEEFLQTVLFDENSLDQSLKTALKNIKEQCSDKELLQFKTAIEDIIKSTAEQLKPFKENKFIYQLENKFGVTKDDIGRIVLSKNIYDSLIKTDRSFKDYVKNGIKEIIEEQDIDDEFKEFDELQELQDDLDKIFEKQGEMDYEIM